MNKLRHREEPFGPLSRRELLRRCGMGMGSVALASLVGRESAQASTSAMNPLTPKAPHFAQKAKRVIHIFANGGPSQVDTFDPKPMLSKYHGKTLPGNHLKTERKTGTAMRSPFEFRKYGESGLEISDLFPNVAQSADELCVIRSMHANVPNHEPSLMLMNTGFARQATPSMGAWVNYGLGTDNENRFRNYYG